MEFWLVMLLLSLPAIIEGASDPLNGWLQPTSEADVRALDCAPLRAEALDAWAPGASPERGRRGDFERRAVLCRQRLMRPGARHPRDEAILSTLRAASTNAAALVAALPETTRARRWLVEVAYPDARLSHKISFAAKNALLDKGLRVSDRAPRLTAGDINVLASQRPAAAYPMACARYDLRPGEALLLLALRDPRATILNAGLCLDRRWRWLQ
ncbi:hypothetical protein KKF91_15720 [Myxococcota bacterium]|nr:hypothetical protein [Myxococcota bacterium]MBU1431989.1 hypothetical protein [Myxococcota bacterium]MBU1897027.1 hypothetical protein [Myxococcota bacterium]